jgi:phosphatidylserine decarboxylase
MPGADFVVEANGFHLCSVHEKWQQPGSEIKKGDELGIFQFGGSSIIVAFQAGRSDLNEDLLEYSRQRVQVSVEVGMSLGKAAKRVS